MKNLVYLEKDGNTAIVTLNKPDRLNAMGESMWRDLSKVFNECDADRDLRCVIIRGAGGRAFSAGADIKEFKTTRKDKETARSYGNLMTHAFNSVIDCRHPVIAQIDGLCVGGGMGIASCCDIRICGLSSKFGVPVKKLGLVEAHEEMRPLVEKFGANVALEILLIGDVFPVADALRMGLINHVVPDDQLAATAHEYARKIADGAPLSARWHKKFIYRLLNPEPLTDSEIEEGFDCYNTEDFRAGCRAFEKKSVPEFFGR
ncbi:MAG: enoyl-CoA hydratase [Rickettsiales bacterium]|jgi:enoyl-CoA hydratase|nr:enoyl-CoA hydratase [Rickettsiales bacterium]